MAEPFHYETSGRSPRTLSILILIYLGLLAGWIFLSVAWWILAFVALTTLPAIYDLWSDRTSGLALEDGKLKWWSGRRSGEMDLNEIDHMRFDTRLDFSVRVSAVTPDKQRVRLPYDALPPHKLFEAACQAQGLKTERHHFSLL